MLLLAPGPGHVGEIPGDGEAGGVASVTVLPPGEGVARTTATERSPATGCTQGLLDAGVWQPASPSTARQAAFRNTSGLYWSK